MNLIIDSLLLSSITHLVPARSVRAMHGDKEINQVDYEYDECFLCNEVFVSYKLRSLVNCIKFNVVMFRRKLHRPS